MSVALNNPYDNYKKSAVETTPAEKLVIMLYEGAIKFLIQAKKAMEEKDYEVSNKLNLKVQDILAELNMSLDMNYGDIPRQLSRLYDFYHRQLILANLKKDPNLLDPVLDFLQEYKAVWEQAIRQSKAG